MLRYRHNDIAHLNSLFYLKNANRNLFVYESLFSMDGDWPDLKQSCWLKHRHNFIWIVDEARRWAGMGRGLCDRAGVLDAVDILVRNFGESLFESRCRQLI